MVEAAAEHEIDTGPTAEEAAALLAEQSAGAATDAEIDAGTPTAEGDKPDAEAGQEG
jgi:large subunit ribosomal protein L3